MYPEELTCEIDASHPIDERVAAACAYAAAAELDDALRMIEHCVSQLTDGQLWRRSGDDLNGIGNLLLHLAGNLRQWAISGLGGAPDERRRPEEFSARGGIAKEELMGALRSCVAETRTAVLPALTAENLLRVRTVQGFRVSGMAALWHTVAHFRGHTQEIIGLTRQILGSEYRFAWKPRTKEEGA